MKTSGATGTQSASTLIDKRIAGLADWRGEIPRTIPKLIHDADPEVLDEVKWRKPPNAIPGVPVWSHDGIICTGEAYKDKVKLTFAKGALLRDTARLFNASLDGTIRRAIDLHERQSVDARAFKALVRAAVDLNAVLARERPRRAK